MKKTTIILLLFLCSKSFGQNDEESQFIDSFFKNRKEKIKYTDKISDYGVNYITDHLKSIDTVYQNNFRDKVKNPELPAKIVVSNSELKEILQKFKRANGEGWIKDKVPNSNYVEPRKVRKDSSYYYLFKPIMIRENTICFFFFGNSEFGKFHAFIKKNGEWIYFARILEWAT